MAGKDRTDPPVILRISPPAMPSAPAPENEQGTTFQIPVVDLKEVQPDVEDAKSLDLTHSRMVLSPVQAPDNEKNLDLTLPLVVVSPLAQVAPNEPEEKYIIPLDGKWTPGKHPIHIGKNFSTLTNMRYADDHPEGVLGMTAINANIPIASYYKARAAYHFVKAAPAESHILVQEYNAGLTASKVVQNITAIPTAGEFTGTALFTDSTGAAIGQFSSAPRDQVVYCNKVDTCIWGGDELKCARFVNFDSAKTFMYDYTDKVTNTKTTEYASFTADTAGGGDDSNVALLLHLDDNYTDSGPNAHTVTNGGTTFGSPAIGGKFSSGGAASGVSTYMTVPNHADFDFSDGTWTIDMWISPGGNESNQLYYQEKSVTKVVYTTGSHAPTVGGAVIQASSGATGTVREFSLASGSWAAGTAAGTIWMDSVTGTWTDGNVMYETTDLLAGDGAFTGAATNWTLAAGFTYSSNAVNKDGDGTGTLAHNTLAAVAGEVYRVTYTISGWSVGTVTASFGGASGAARGADGTYTEILTAASTAGLAFTPTNTARFTIDTVVVNTTICTGATCTTDINYFKLGLVPWTNILYATIRKHEVVTSPIYASGLGISYSFSDWYHVQFSENGDTWYAFLNGSLVFTGTDTIRAEVYTSAVNLFRHLDPGTPYYGSFWGYFDEVRVSKTCRNVGSFIKPAAPYSTPGGSGSIGNVYIGSVRPLKGIKFYVGTANDSTSTAVVSYWNGSSFTQVAGQVDYTASSGKTLKVTGGQSITFDSTVATAKPGYIDGSFLYFYNVSFSGIDAATTVYYVTVDAPFQNIIDLWDNEYRAIASCYQNLPTLTDRTLQIRTDTYLLSDTSSWLNLGSFATGDSLEIGFTEKITALLINVAPNGENTTANTLASVSYWNGAQYVSVGSVTDQTISTPGISLGKSGVFSWYNTTPTSENKKSIAGGYSLYYYKITFSQTLSASCAIYYVGGIPLGKEIKGYSFAIHAADRLMLGCDNYQYKNRMIISAGGTDSVWNGSDYFEIDFGNADALTCGTSIFAQYASNIFNMVLAFKETEMWTLTWGYNNDEIFFDRYQVSPSIGCPAPATLKTISAELEKNVNQAKTLAIWRGNKGVYISNGQPPLSVSDDIAHVFDQTKTPHVDTSMLVYEQAFVDQHKHEYHWLWATELYQISFTTGAHEPLAGETITGATSSAAGVVDHIGTITGAWGSGTAAGIIYFRPTSGTWQSGEVIQQGVTTAATSSSVATKSAASNNSLNKEYVLDLQRWKWYEIDRTTGLYVQMGIEAKDTEGNYHTYGFIDNATGTMCRLENGATFLGTDITATLETGAQLPIAADLLAQTSISRANLIAVAKNTDSAVTLTHTIDGSTAGGTAYSLSVADATHIYANVMQDIFSLPGTFHVFKLSATTDDETKSLEPLYLSVYYTKDRDHTR